MKGQGTSEDIVLLDKVAANMKGRTICALAEAAALPAMSFVNKFRDEFEYFVREKKSKVTGTSPEKQYAEMHH